MSDGGIRAMPGTTYRNGLPESGGYVYKGSGRDELAPEAITAANRQRVRSWRAINGRCPECGYLPGSIGCTATCGGGQ